MTALFLAAALAVQSPTPQLPSAAVPTPQGWGPPPAAAAGAPAAFPIATLAPAPPPLYSIVLQAAQPAAVASAVFAPASSQFSPAAAPYVNPFVTTQFAPAAATTNQVLTGAVLVAHQPWVGDRMIGHLGQHLSQRGLATVRAAPVPAAASSGTVMLGQSTTVLLSPGPTHQSRFGRWFWGQ